MTIFGYARVSTDGQTLDSQVEALKAFGCEKIFREKISGAKADRPELTKLLATIDSGDKLVVTRLDRLARSTRDLLNIVEAITQRGAAFKSLGDEWADTTTPHGRLMLTVLGGLAEFERELIRARTGEGRARAVARGQHMGRPPKLTPHQWREAEAELANGAATQADLARRFNVSESTISRLATKAAMPPARTIDPDTKRAALAFLARIKQSHAPVTALLYGSRARGTHTADSDADIAVILKGEPKNRYEVLGPLSDASYEVLIETGIRVQALPLWESELQRPELFSNPALIENIKREGLRL